MHIRCIRLKQPGTRGSAPMFIFLCVHCTNTSAVFIVLLLVGSVLILYTQPESFLSLYFVLHTLLRALVLFCTDFILHGSDRAGLQ
jgi:hypothetical protein